MPEPNYAIRKQLADFEVLLDNEEARLRVLAGLADGQKRRRVQQRLEAIRKSRERLRSTLKDIEGNGASAVMDNRVHEPDHDPGR